MKRYFYILITLLFILLFSSCDEDKIPSKIFFSQENAFLSPKTTDFDLGITFASPIKWDLRNTEISKRIEGRGNTKGFDGDFIFSPSYVYFDDSTNSVLSLGKVIPPDSLVENPQVMNIYSQILVSKKSIETDYEIDQFSKDGIKFTQFSIDRGTIVSKRIVFQNKFNDIIQFEYTSRKNFFDSEYQKILQSIGSITLL